MQSTTAHLLTSNFLYYQPIRFLVSAGLNQSANSIFLSKNQHQPAQTSTSTLSKYCVDLYPKINLLIHRQPKVIMTADKTGYNIRYYHWYQFYFWNLFGRKFPGHGSSMGQSESPAGCFRVVGAERARLLRPTGLTRIRRGT